MTLIFVSAGSGLAIEQTPAKPGSSGRLDVLPESNNSLTGSRADSGEVFVPPESGPRHRADPC
jgi:hypothetical protein